MAKYKAAWVMIHPGRFVFKKTKQAGYISAACLY
jgi:hypothetical protein